MSTFAPARLRCRSGHAFVVEVADSLHVSRRPDLRERILEGTFHRFVCPTCGVAVGVEKQLVYTDFPRRHWFTVLPPPEIFHWRYHAEVAAAAFQDTMLDRAPAMVQTWAPEFTTRVLFGLAGLRETLVVLDAGLDDLWLHAVKLGLVEELRIVRDPQTVFDLTSVESGGALVFAYRPPGTAQPVELRLQRSEVEALVGTADADLDQSFDHLVTDWRTSIPAVC